MTTAAGTVARMQWGLPPTEQQPTTPVVTPDAVQTNVFTGLQEGMTQQDRGDGTYDILHNGEVLGTGYKGVMDAYKEIGWNNATSKTAEADGVWTNPLLGAARQFWADAAGNEVQANFSSPEEWDQSGLTQTQKFEATQFKSKDEVDTALKGLLSQNQNFNGTMGEWEALGQVLNGEAYAQAKNFGNLPTNDAEEKITGPNVLFGSTPVMTKGEDGKFTLAGYRTDLTPNEAKDFSNGTDTAKQTDFGTFISHNGKSHSWANANWRELANAAWWKDNTIAGADGSVFIPTDKAKDAAGWTNKNSYQNQDTKNSLFGSIFDALDPVLDKTMPGHNKTQDNIKKLMGTSTQKQAFEQVAPIVVAIVAAVLTAGAGSAAAGGAAGGGAGATAGGAATGAAAGTGAATTGTAVGTGAAAGTTALTTGQMVGYGLSGLNAANAASKGDWTSAILSLVGTGFSSGAFGDVLSGAGSIASEYASALGMSAEAQTAASSMVKGFFAGDLAKMTNGAITLPGSANVVVGSAVRNAVKNAALAGVSGAELDNVMKTAIVSAVGSLVGGTVSSQTGSSLAGTVSGAVTGGLLNQATRDDPKVQSPAATATPTKPAATAPTSKNAAGFVARMNWRT